MELAIGVSDYRPAIDYNNRTEFNPKLSTNVYSNH